MSSHPASDKPPDKPSDLGHDATVREITTAKLIDPSTGNLIIAASFTEEDRPDAAPVTFSTIEFRDGTPVSLAIAGRTYHGHVDSANGQFVVSFGAAGVSDEH
jgi:hypothetical protein